VISGNIDQSKEEFFLDYNYDPPRIVLNNNYSEVIGTSADVTTMEILGIADGVQNIFLTEYSPIDPSGTLEVWSYLQPDVPTQWTQLSTFTDFSEGYLKEFKVDYDLGRIIFDSEGNGQIPGGGLKIVAYYTKGLTLRYEPEGSRDTTALVSSDINPLNTGVSTGVVQVTSGARNAATLLLDAEMDVSALNVNNLTADVGNSLYKVLGTVRDSNGIGVDGLLVNFSILDSFGTFSNGSTEAVSLSDEDGIATTFFVPPTTIDGFGYVTDDLEHSGSNTWLTFEDAIEPDNLSGLFLYQIQESDTVLGLSEDGLVTQYIDFF
jgi:hypothetical protein